MFKYFTLAFTEFQLSINQKIAILIFCFLELDRTSGKSCNICTKGACKFEKQSIVRKSRFRIGSDVCKQNFNVFKII